MSPSSSLESPGHLVVEQVDVWQGHQSGVGSLCFSSDGNLLASAANYNDVRIWNVLQRETVRTLMHYGRPGGIATQGHDIMGLAFSQTIRCWQQPSRMDSSGFGISPVRGW